MSSPGTTVVTAVYDLARREPGHGRLSPREQLVHGTFVLGLDANLLCYCEPQLADRLRGLREQSGLEHRTMILARELESLPGLELLEHAAAARARHPLVNGDPAIDTALALVLGWARFGLLADAASDDQSGSDHLAWVDFDIGRYAKTGHHDQDRVFTQTPDSIRVLQMEPFVPGLLGDPPHHFAYRREHFAPGLISGAIRSLKELWRIVDEDLRQALSDGMAPLDEHLLEIAATAHPELFSLYYGDRDHIIENYRCPRGSALNLLLFMREWRWALNWEPAAALAAQIVDSVVRGEFESEPGTLASLLEECFLAAFYATTADQRLAKRCAALYAEHAHRDADFREEFLRHEIRVRTNLAFVDQKI